MLVQDIVDDADRLQNPRQPAAFAGSPSVQVGHLLRMLATILEFSHPAWSTCQLFTRFLAQSRGRISCMLACLSDMHGQLVPGPLTACGAWRSTATCSLA